MTPNNPPLRIRFGPYEADFHSKELRKQGMKLKLSGQPLQILEMLLARPGELVNREELQKQLWSDDAFVDSNHGLNAAVNKLRDALGDSADEPKYIETLPRRGYRFIGTIEQAAANPAKSPIPILPVVAIPISSFPQKAEELPSPEAPKPVPFPVSSRRNMAERRVFFAAAAMLLLGIAVSAYLSWKPQTAANLMRPFLKYVAENVAIAARSSQRPGAHGHNAGDSVTLQGEDGNDAQAEENYKNERRKYADERMTGKPDDDIAIRGTRVLRTDIQSPFTISPLKSADPILRTVVADDNGNAGPQFSPDGKRIAFMSTRSGAWQIWVSDTNGANPRQVSFTESAGTPRWSPDGRSIAFDAPFEGETRVFVVKVDGDITDRDGRDGKDNERAHPIVRGLVPSFSRDGKWVYFASDQTGDWQVWKVTIRGGREEQVTTNGGFAALESGDGYIYYSKSRYPQPEICRVPVTGGTESCVLQHLRPRTWASWAVTREGILFAEDLPDGHPTLSLYDPAKHELRDLVSLRSAPFWVGASADGKRAIMNDADERQISMVDNLP